jgi:hypothetical protein
MVQTLESRPETHQRLLQHSVTKGLVLTCFVDSIDYVGLPPDLARHGDQRQTCRDLVKEVIQTSYK